MKRFNEDLSKILADADTAEDRETLEAAIQRLDEILQEGFDLTDTPMLPYAPALEMTDAFAQSYISDESGGAESGLDEFLGDLAIDAANALARAKRRAEYRLKTLFGFKGIRIVEDGDSWTQYPVFLEDIGDQLQSKADLALFSVGGAGDLVSDMATEKEYLSALKRTDAPALVISGGGNDMFAHLADFLVDYSDGAEPIDLIDQSKFSPFLTAVMDSYATILSDVAASFPSVTVFTHGYDLPYPLQDGKWIGPALDQHKIPFEIGRSVLKVIMDMFNMALIDLEAHQPNMVFCDLRGKVGLGQSSWHDELHPKNAGFARAAAILEGAIRAHSAGRAEATSGPKPPEFNAENASAGKVVVLDPGHGGTATVGGSSPNNAIGPGGTLEKTLTLDVAQRTKAILEDRGFTVLMTRNTDVNLGLSARAAVARNAGAAAFVSIHFNASNSHNAQGTETFVHNSLSDGPHHSKALCRAVQAEMVTALGLRDRNAGHELGAKRGGFGVLNPRHHASHSAAVLHEVSFLDRADEEQRLLTVSYRRKVAVALADGVEAYLERIAPAESFFSAETEVGDAIELARFETKLNAEIAQVVDWTTQDASPAAGWSDDDISNGHQIGNDVAHDDESGFLHDLAAMEARFVSAQGHSVTHADEGEEPSDFDSAAERAFSATSADVAQNMSLLSGVFGGAESTGFSHAEFEAFILSLGLRHFSPSEFLVLGGQNRSGRCKGKNTLPPKSLWSNLTNTALMIDEIRERLNAPVYITSAYRSSAYNACINGAARRSQHMRFNALDWYCTSHSRAHWRRVAEEVSRSDPGRFKGFIDDYARGNFVHIDTRDA